MGGDRDVFRHEDVVEGVDVAFGRRAAVLPFPGLGDPRQRGQRRDMRPLGHAHRTARFVDADLDAEFGERLDERAHRGERPVVDDGAGPIENHRLDALHVTGFLLNRNCLETLLCASS